MGSISLYGLGKIHKETKNGIRPFCSVLSAIGTPIYRVTKFLLHFLAPSTTNEYTVIDLFHFADENRRQEPNFYMTSLDTDSLVAMLC